MSIVRRYRLPRPGRGMLALALLLAACDNPFDSDGDRSPPQVVIEAPTSGQSVESDSAVVQGTVRDNRGVERMAFRLNGGAEQPVEVTPGKTAAFRFVARGLAVGANELEVLAYDAAEHAGTGKVSFSSRDVKAPVLEVRTPVEGEMTGRDSVRVTGRATDDRGVASLAYSLDGAAEVAVPVTPGKEVAFDFTLRGIAAGEHTLVVKTRDVGGTEAARTLRFTVPLAELRITTPAAGEVLGRFATPLRATVDSPVGITRVTYSVNGGSEVAMCVPQGIGQPPQCLSFPAGRNELAWTADALPQGEVRVRVTAYAADRVAAAATVVFRVDVPVRRYRVSQVIRQPGSTAFATALNNRNQVAGYVDDSSAPIRTRPFFWENGVLRTPDTGDNVYTPDRVLLNETGQVAGTLLRMTSPTAGCPMAFFWVPGTSWQERPCRSSARGLNDRGNVLVNVEENGIGNAHLWSPAAGTLTPFNRGDYTWAVGFGLNNADVAAALLYRAGGGSTPTALLRLSQAPEVIFTTESHACGNLLSFEDAGEWVCSAGIYRNGQVTTGPSIGVGPPILMAANRQRETIGFYLWRAPRGTRDLGELRIAYWAGGATYDVVIDDPAWELSRTTVGFDINDSGVVLARAFNRATQESAAVLLTPVP